MVGGAYLLKESRPIITWNTKIRGSIGVLGFKAHAKVRRIGFFFPPTFSESVNSVWVLNYQCQAQQKFSSENIASYLHVEPIPAQKKTNGGNFLIFSQRDSPRPLGGPRKGAIWSKNPLTAPLWKYIQRKLCQVSFCNLAWCLETCRAFGRKKQWRKRGREQKVM